MLAAGDEGPLADLGPEPGSEEFAAFIRTSDSNRHLTTDLRDQHVVSGIGRGWGDDILQRAKLSPFASLRSLTPEQREALLAAATGVLAEALELERTRPGGLSESSLGGRFKVHNRFGEPCPTCGSTLAARVVRVLRDGVLPGVPNRWQGPGRPTALAPAEVGGTMTAEPTVILRDCTASDLDALEEYWIPEVRRWLAGMDEPGDRRTAQEYVDRAMSSARAVPRLRYDLVAEADGRFLGTGRIVASDPLNASGDIGYAIRQSEWGKGYASAIARQLLDIGFGPLGLHRISATVHPDNAAAVRVLEKAGLRYEGRLRDHYRVPGGWRDSLLYAVLSTDT